MIVEALTGALNRASNRSCFACWTAFSSNSSVRSLTSSSTVPSTAIWRKVLGSSTASSFAAVTQYPFLWSPITFLGARKLPLIGSVWYTFSILFPFLLASIGFYLQCSFTDCSVLQTVCIADLTNVQADISFQIDSDCRKIISGLFVPIQGSE